MNICDRIRERLAEEGPAIGKEPDVRRHLQDCAGCQSLHARLQRIEGALQDLPEHDASDALVAETLQAVRDAHPPQQMPKWRLGNHRHLAGALAASVVIAAIFGLTYDQLKPYLEGDLRAVSLTERRASEPLVLDQLAEAPTPEPEPLRDDDGGQAPASVVAQTEAMENEVSEIAGLGAGSTTGAAVPAEKPSASKVARTAPSPSFSYEAGEGEQYQSLGRESLLIAGLDDRLRRVEGQETFFERDSQGKFEKKQSTDRPADLKEAAPDVRTKNKDALVGAEDPIDEGSYRAEEDAFRGNEPAAIVAGPPSQQQSRESEMEGNRLTHAEASKPAPSRQLADKEVLAQESRSSLSGQKIQVQGELKRDQSAAAGAAQDKAAAGLTPGYAQFGDDARGDRLAALSKDGAARGVAQQFLERIFSLEGLTDQDPIGYWSNSYIPGDPAMRLLRAQLRQWEAQHAGADLAEGAGKYEQPFDAPQNAAIAVYLHADRSAVEGPTRIRLQVGLKGAERRGGHRPAMNVSLVVDPRSFRDAQSGAKLRALLMALEESRQPGDRFSLVVAGSHGGLLVEPAAFRHGPLRLAIEKILSKGERNAGPVISLEEAVSLAAANLRRGDDPSDTLKPGLVLLAGAASSDVELTGLERVAHVNAVGGIPLSVVGFGAQADPDQQDRLAAAGQGRRWVLDTPGAAVSLIDRELHASSRAVARAVRLRIRLAPGAKLIGVLGSRRLEEVEAGRVREAEQAIDHRLARNLGIEADRGADEEGIQIVIPAFYAGDTHSILLDMVVEGPGPVADVTARYKDVAYLRNGVSRAQLTIPQGPNVQGPLERNVLKNLTALEIAARLKHVARDLREGSIGPASVRLAALRVLIQGLRSEVSGWAGDRELAADEAMVDGYLAAVLSADAAGPDRRSYLVRSLQYAAFRKLQSPARKS